MLSWANISHADEINDIVTLKKYVRKICPRNCVTISDLVASLQTAKDTLGVDPVHMLAIIRTESSFNTKAVNGGSKGLTQVLLRYHRKHFKTDNYFDPKDNIRVGSLIYSQCYKRHKANLAKSMRCYNGGGDPKYFTKITRHISDINSLNMTSLFRNQP